MRQNLITTFILAILSCVHGNLSAQIEQRGVVLEYQGDQAKTPLSKVSISAKDAGNVLSEDNGTFTLQFRTLHPGSDIQMRRIEKAGYEVMNQELVEQFRVGGKESRPIQVVMCSKSKLQQLRDNYRSVASKRYEQQLKLSEAEAEKLRQEGKLKEEEYNARLDALEEEYEEKLTQLENYIDKFARIDLSEVDAYEQQIVGLVQEGKFDDAIALYDQQDFPGKIKQSREARQKLVDMKTTIAQAELAQTEENQRLRQSIDRQITLLRMAGGEENLKKAHELLHQVYLADTTHVTARREYAFSLRLFGQHEEAIALLVSGEKSTGNAIDRGMILLELSEIFWQMEDYDRSYDAARMADSLMTPLSSANSIVISRALPAWSDAQLRYYTSQGNMAGALRIAQRVEREWDPDTLSCQSLASYVALAGNLGDFYTRSGQNDRALWCTDESIRLGEALYRKAPWQSNLFEAYANASYTYALLGDSKKAIAAARSSARIMGERIDKSGLKSACLDAAYNYYLLAEILVGLDEYQLADSIMQGVKTRRVFEKIASDGGLFELYTGLYRYFEAVVCLYQGSVADAEVQAQKALSQIEHSGHGAVFQVRLQNEFQSRACLSKGLYKEASVYCQKAIDECATLYKETQDAWDADALCREYLMSAKIHLQSGNKGKAKKSLQNAAKVAAFESNRQAIEDMKEKIRK